MDEEGGKSMNKTAMKTFATNARTELLSKVKAQALKIGITKENTDKAKIESSDAIYIGDRQLLKEERIQRDRLIKRINQHGFDLVIDEVAYTWFNRFTALRFMEVNNYLPTKVRVLSSSHSETNEPDMIREALSLDLDIDKERVYEWKEKSETNELFKYLIIKHCNDLNRYMPFMFEKINDYTEILFPEGLLLKDSFMQRMTNHEVIPEEDWQQVEIIGWLYQFYIAEEKERVFKQKKKYLAEEIPYATQLFTPNWIVRYMVQNSLGRYWVESHPEHSDLIDDWELYIENSQQEIEEAKTLAPYMTKQLNVEDIKCFDPAMGSGHILVYMFDVLYEIYYKCGYMEKEIPRLIIENNLYGLDIDDRAYQLASFSIVMKALEYNKRFFRSIEREGLTLNLASIQETNSLQHEDIAYIAGESEGELFDATKTFIEQFHDAKTIGSLLRINDYDHAFFQKRLEDIQKYPSADLFGEEIKKRVLLLLEDVLNQANIMSLSYDILVTNPPYMGGGNMPFILSEFVKEHYPHSKADLFACFMELDHYLKKEALYASINQHSWMFLSSFEKLREKLIRRKTISSMIHLGPRVFEEISGEVVQSTSFVLRNNRAAGERGNYIRLVDERTIKGKIDKALLSIRQPDVFYRYSFDQQSFSKIPGSPIAYWLSESAIGAFDKNLSIQDFGQTRKGMVTADNERFIRQWTELDFNKIALNIESKEKAKESELKWFPYQKGGKYRKWYGNNEEVVNWENGGFELLHMKGNGYKVGSTNHNLEYIFKPAVTWNKITSGHLTARYSDVGYLYDDASPFFSTDDKNSLMYTLSFMSSKVSQEILKAINPTLNFQPGNVAKLPLVISQKYDQQLITLAEENIILAKEDWDSFETSWNFKQHPILKNKTDSLKIESAFENRRQYVDGQYHTLKANEEKINELFIEIYGFENELTPEVDEEDVSIRRADLEFDMKSWISYAVGCIFGRYSLDEEGLIYAGGEFDPSRYETFPADQYNILPVLPGAYFEDDIVTRFIDFIRVTFSDKTLGENLDFIAEAIGKKKGETAKETIRRYFLDDFFKNHLRTNKKRPFYWLFSSGKQKAFNCFIYMHRYDKSTLSRIRTDYLHEYQNRLDVEKKDLVNLIESDASSNDISKNKKKLQILDKKIAELKTYDEKLHHLADQQIELELDHGVKVNYEIFAELVAKV